MTPPGLPAPPGRSGAKPGERPPVALALAAAEATGGLGGIAPRPRPDPAVLAAVVAAADEVWPRPVVVAPEPQPESSVWRFSGRWWRKPVSMRRDRPWARP